MQFPIRRMNRNAPATPEAVLFLDRESHNLTAGGKTDLILSPSLYWFRGEVLPAKNVFQAKKLAPSLFDAVAPEGRYSYFAIKRPETFWLFAYDETLIADTIARAGLRPHMIRNVYFAQTECEGLETAVRISDTMALVNSDGAITQLPVRYVSDAVDGQRFFNGRKRSRYKMALNLYHNALLDKKQINTMSAVALLFFLVYTVNYLMANNNLNRVLAKEEALKEQYRLPQTSFELEGLLRSLESKQQRQAVLREKAKALFSLPLGAGNHVDQLAITEKKIALTVALEDEKDARSITEALKRHITITSDKVKNKILYVDGTYE